MDKRDLVELTIERLLANFERSPESFDLKDQSSVGAFGGPTITWRPRILRGNYDSVAVDDPNNSNAVVISCNPISLELSCYIFTNFMGSLDISKATHQVSCLQSFMFLRGTYRKFKKLSKLIEARDLRAENMNYLAKLSSVFPDTLDKHLLKD